MDQHTLLNAPVADALVCLGLPAAAPTLRYLNRLIAAYIRKVPWESVSRIVKRSSPIKTST